MSSSIFNGGGNGDSVGVLSSAADGSLLLSFILFTDIPTYSCLRYELKHQTDSEGERKKARCCCKVNL
jgi:hypothetical protein